MDAHYKNYETKIMTFEKAFELLIGNEGLYTVDARDRGNWTDGKCGYGKLKGTKYGICAASYPGLDIRNLTLDDARGIYKKDFWDAINAEDLPESIRFDMFDLAVNSGTGTAKKMLQIALGVKEDGKIGPQTLLAAANMDPQLLDKRLSAYRLLYLCDLKTFSSFGKGWIKRVANNLLKD